MCTHSCKSCDDLYCTFYPAIDKGSILQSMWRTYKRWALMYEPEKCTHENMHNVFHSRLHRWFDRRLAERLLLSESVITHKQHSRNTLHRVHTLTGLGDGPVILFAFSCWAICRFCYGWLVQPLSAWDISDWERSGFGSFLGSTCRV